MTVVSQGALVNNAQQMGLASIPEFINVHTGNTPTALTRPADRSVQYLLIHVEFENFRCQVGDTTATIGAYQIPTADVTDGTGTLALENGEIYVFTAPTAFTVVGETANSVMTYAWV